MKPWSVWPALLPVTTPVTPVTTKSVTTKIEIEPAVIGSVVTSTTTVPPVLERPSSNKRRTWFPSTTFRISKLVVQKKKVKTTTVAPVTLSTVSSTLAPVTDTKLANVTFSNPFVAAPSAPNQPASVPSVDLTYRSRLTTGMLFTTTPIPNSTSSFLSSTPFILLTNPGSEGQVEEMEAAVHLGNTSVGGLVTAVVLGVLAILGALVGLGFWFWHLRSRVAAGATVSAVTLTIQN